MVRAVASPIVADNVGYIVIDDLSQDLRSDLHDAGVSDDDLRSIAGRDGVVRGAEELDNLFTRLREPTRALVRPGRQSLFDALRAHVERNRQAAMDRGGRRFSHDPVLMQVLEGHLSLGPQSPAASVFRVEQALADIGFLDPTAVDGDFDDLTMKAVERFQIEADVPVTSRIDAATLGALIGAAPPPGEKLVTRPEYDRMLATDRLEVTIALGAGDRGYTRAQAELAVIEGLLDRGFERVPPRDAARLRELGLDGVDPHVDVWTNGETTLHIVMPANDEPASGRAAARAAERSGAVLWTGRSFDLAEAHTRRTGLLGRRAPRPSSARPAYQLVCVSGCDASAGPVQDRLLGRAQIDTDLLATDRGAPESSRGHHALGFLDAVLARADTAVLRRALGESSATERGFLFNRSNATEAHGA